MLRRNDLSDSAPAVEVAPDSRRRSTCYQLGEAIDAGWIVDSSGLKAFGLTHFELEALARTFVEIRPLLGHCRSRDCRHDREPGCAVQEAAARDDIAPHRVALLHRLVRESQAVRDPAR